LELLDTPKKREIVPEGLPWIAGNPLLPKDLRGKTKGKTCAMTGTGTARAHRPGQQQQKLQVWGAPTPYDTA